MKHTVWKRVLAVLMILCMLPSTVASASGALSLGDAGLVLPAEESAEEAPSAPAEEPAPAEEAAEPALDGDGDVTAEAGDVTAEEGGVTAGDEESGTSSDTGSESGGETPDPVISIPIESDAFPDPIFRTYLHANCDGDEDGYLTTDELEEITYIDFTEHTDYNLLNSLEGIEYFTNLSWLICNNGGIDTLDLSANTKLYQVEVQNHNMTELDLTGLTNLRYLNCSGNKLTELDISDCAGLKELKCSSNHDLTELDVTNNPNIKNAVEFGEEQTYDGFRKFYQANSYYGDNVLWIDSDVGIIGAVAAISGVYIDEYSFPDGAFRSKVASSYDINPQNGWLSAKEAAAVTSMSLGSAVEDSTGIEYFTALTSFTSYDGQFASLDLSASPNLERIELYRCSNLTVLNVAGLENLTYFRLVDSSVLPALDLAGCTNLTDVCIDRYTVMEGALASLYLTGCFALESLTCWDQSLAALDLTDCTALKELSLTGNELTALDVSSCTLLTELDVGNNDLTALDISACTELQSLDCSGNCLTALDVSHNPALTRIAMYSNPIAGKLDVSGCPELCGLSANETNVTSVDLSGCEALEYLYLRGTGITSLDISDCSALYDLDLSEVAVKTLDISGNPRLIAAVEAGVSDSGCSADQTVGWIEYQTTESDDYYTYYCTLTVDETLKITGADVPEGRLISALHFPDADFRRAVASSLGVREYDFVPAADFLACTSLGEDSSTEGAADLTGLELFPNLTVLRIVRAEVTEVDLSLVPQLTSLDLTQTPIAELDLSAVPNLTSLDCTLTAVTELDLTANEILWNRLVGVEPNEQGYVLEDGTEVYIYEYYDDENGELILACSQDTVILPKLDDPTLVKMFPDAAFRAYLKENFDTDGDGCLSDEELAAVTEMDCSGLGIASMDGLEYFENLEKLDCSDNALTALSVSSCEKLVWLDCSDNGISSLYLRNQAFEELYLGGNPLTSMQLSSAETLRVLDIHDTDMTSMSLNNYSALEELDVSGTGVTHLELETCTALRQLNCSNTAVSYLYVDSCEVLVWLIDNVEPAVENGIVSYVSADEEGDIFLVYDEDASLSYTGSGSSSSGGVSDEIAELYVEYLIETLTPALESGLIEAGLLEEIVILAECGEYEYLEEIGLYTGELIPGVVPMTVEEFAASLEQPETPDLTGDGVMDEDDAELILNYLVFADGISGEKLETADVNGDGAVDARDATQILRHANGLTSVLD